MYNLSRSIWPVTSGRRALSILSLFLCKSEIKLPQGSLLTAFDEKLWLGPGGMMILNYVDYVWTRKIRSQVRISSVPDVGIEPFS